jgi:hypothetical protein
MKFCHSQVNGWNIISSEISQTQKAKKPHVLSHMWNIDLTQMQLYYETLVTLKGMSLMGIGKLRT